MGVFFGLAIWIKNIPVKNQLLVSIYGQHQQTTPIFSTVVENLSIKNILSKRKNLEMEKNLFVVWRGFLKVPKECNYFFQIKPDLKIRLWIQNMAVIDTLTAEKYITNSGVKLLSQDYPIEIEYLHDQGNKDFLLEWREESSKNWRDLVESVFLPEEIFNN